MLFEQHLPRNKLWKELYWKVHKRKKFPVMTRLRRILLLGISHLGAVRSHLPLVVSTSSTHSSGPLKFKVRPVRDVLPLSVRRWILRLLCYYKTSVEDTALVRHVYRTNTWLFGGPSFEFSHQFLEFTPAKTCFVNQESVRTVSLSAHHSGAPPEF